MAIIFTCGCGAVLKTVEAAAGKHGKCPRCAKILRVPLPEAANSLIPKRPRPYCRADDPMLDACAETGAYEVDSDGSGTAL